MDKENYAPYVNPSHLTPQYSSFPVHSPPSTSQSAAFPTLNNPQVLTGGYGAMVMTGPPGTLGFYSQTTTQNGGNVQAQLPQLDIPPDAVSVRQHIAQQHVNDAEKTPAPTSAPSQPTPSQNTQRRQPTPAASVPPVSTPFPNSRVLNSLSNTATPVPEAPPPVPIPTSKATNPTRGGSTANRASKRGKGSRSGKANRRDAGESDAEVEGLTEEQRAAAASSVTNSSGCWSDDERMKAMAHITNPEVWPDVRGGGAMKVFQHVSQVVLEGSKDVTQIRSLYNKYWGMYKIVRRREEHTGGKDGDELSDEFESDGENEDMVSTEGKNGGKKRKRKKKDRFSPAQLQAFKESAIYEMFDNVAHNDKTVVREHTVSSSDSIADNPSGSKKRVKMEPSDAILEKLADGAAKRQAMAIELAKMKLEFARKKEERKARQVKEELQVKKSRQIMDMLAHPDELIQKMGRKMAEELAKEMGIEY